MVQRIIQTEISEEIQMVAIKKDWQNIINVLATGKMLRLILFMTVSVIDDY